MKKFFIAFSMGLACSVSLAPVASEACAINAVPPTGYVKHVYRQGGMLKIAWIKSVGRDVDTIHFMREARGAESLDAFLHAHLEDPYIPGSIHPEPSAIRKIDICGSAFLVRLHIQNRNTDYTVSQDANYRYVAGYMWLDGNKPDPAAEKAIRYGH